MAAPREQAPLAPQGSLERLGRQGLALLQGQTRVWLLKEATCHLLPNWARWPAAQARRALALALALEQEQEQEQSPPRPLPPPQWSRQRPRQRPHPEWCPARAQRAPRGYPAADPPRLKGCRARAPGEPGGCRPRDRRGRPYQNRNPAPLPVLGQELRPLERLPLPWRTHGRTAHRTWHPACTAQHIRGSVAPAGHRSLCSTWHPRGFRWRRRDSSNSWAYLVE